MKGKQEIGRIAFRVEGEFWNAYWAPRQDTMDDAVLLASICMSAVTGKHLARKDEFMSFVQAVFADAVQDSIGQRPTWGGLQRAPERERSGSA